MTSVSSGALQLVLRCWWTSEMVSAIARITTPCDCLNKVCEIITLCIVKRFTFWAMTSVSSGALHLVLRCWWTSAMASATTRITTSCACLNKVCKIITLCIVTRYLLSDDVSFFRSTAIGASLLVNFCDGVCDYTHHNILCLLEQSL